MFAALRGKRSTLLEIVDFWNLRAVEHLQILPRAPSTLFWRSASRPRGRRRPTVRAPIKWLRMLLRYGADCGTVDLRLWLRSSWLPCFPPWTLQRNPTPPSSATVMLYPLQWQHIFIPVLPKSKLSYACGTPRRSPASDAPCMQCSV